MNQRFLTAMVEMGIAVEKAEVALSETGNVGIEVFSAPSPCNSGNSGGSMNLESCQDACLSPPLCLCLSCWAV